MLSVPSLLNWPVLTISCYFLTPLFTHMIKKWHLRSLPNLTNSNSFYGIYLVFIFLCFELCTLVLMFLSVKLSRQWILSAQMD